MSQPPELAEAIRLDKAGQPEKSRLILREFLQRDPANVDALLWLARVSADQREASAAAELALTLQPENEIAKRAVSAVQLRFAQPAEARPVEIMRVTGMTLSQARAVTWPFRNLQRPIGVLLDEKELSLRDLAWAFQNAYEQHSLVKQAARTLLLAQLLGDRPTEPPPPMRVIEGTAHSEAMEHMMLVRQGFLVAIATAAYLVAVGLVLGGLLSMLLLRTPVMSISMSLAGICLFGITELVLRLTDSQTARGKQYRAGRMGEARVADVMRASLYGSWTLIRNMEWLERRWGDVDMVLIGPGGLWVFEVKAYTTPTRNLGNKWQQKGRWGWRKLSGHPGQQAKRNAMNVREYLDLHGVAVKWVQSVIIWAGEDDILSVEDPEVPVWKLSELPERIEEFWRQQKLSDEQVQQAVRVLSEALEKAKAAKAEAKK